jgi:hypothetical protein
MEFGRRQILAGIGGVTLIPVLARAQAVASAPFVLLNGKMFVDVTVNGVAAQAFVDTGAVFTGVDTAFAKTAQVKLGLPLIMRGIQGLRGARSASDVKIEIGGAVVTGPAVVTDYSQLAAQVRHAIDAVVGGDVFRAYVVEIDFDDQRLSLHERATFQPPSTARLIPLGAKNQMMTAEVEVEGHGLVQALVDLGNNAPLIVSPGPAKAVGLLTGRPVSTARMGGQGPTTIAQITTAAYVALAGERFDKVPVLVPPRSIGLDANLGLPILQRFRLYLDFGGQRMWLGGASEARNEPFVRDYTGLAVDITGDVLKVNHVARGGPADRAGWKVGDIITRINGDAPVEANQSLALSAQPGHQVQFTLADGSVRTLTLAEYY